MKQLLLAAGVCASVMLRAQTISTDLLLYYPFDGNFNDYSGNGYHGTGTATLGADSLGNAGSAAYFNGINQYIDFPNLGVLKPDFPFSFSYWIKADTLLSENGTVFTTSFNNDVHSGAWMNFGSGGTIGISIGNGGPTMSSSRYGRSSAGTLTKGRWHHIVAIARSGTDIDIYIDCMLSNGVYDGGSSGTLVYTSGAGSLGRKDANGAGVPEYYLKGALDEFRYWNREIMFSEVSYLCELHLQDVSENVQPYDQLSVFPNPASHSITFESLGGLDYKTIEIYDMTGAMVSAQPYQETISIGSLATGIYTAKLKTETGVYTVQFAKY